MLEAPRLPLPHEPQIVLLSSVCVAPKMLPAGLIFGLKSLAGPDPPLKAVAGQWLPCHLVRVSTIIVLSPCLLSVLLDHNWHFLSRLYN